MSHLRHGRHSHGGQRGAWGLLRRYELLRMHDDVEGLEELQRDLEEAAADVAARVKRLREREETP